MNDPFWQLFLVRQGDGPDQDIFWILFFSCPFCLASSHFLFRLGVRQGLLFLVFLSLFTRKMQNLFLDGYVTEPAIIESSFTRKFCGIMSLRAGCACACLVWIGIGLYGSILAFQYKSPIFSYISSGALIAQGVICLLLVIAAGVALAGLYGESMVILNHAHRYIWLMVIAFLIDFLVTIVIFGIEQQDNSNWCYDESYNHVDDQAAANGNTTVVTYTVPGNVDFYNCSKIWQDELKFAIALMVIFLIFFVCSSLCPPPDVYRSSKEKQGSSRFIFY
ncbi:hypothetical protein BC940DRAFT_309308, partial [Gongronella butleri]